MAINPVIFKKSLYQTPVDRKPPTFLERNGRSMTHDPLSLFLHQPPGNATDKPFYIDPYVDFDYVDTVEGYVTYP